MNNRMFLIILMILSSILLSSCGGNKNKLSFEDKMLIEYSNNGRESRFYELKERYDSRLVLYLNKAEDRAWIVNFTVWFATLFIDIPEIVATGGIVAIIWIVAWFIGVALTGGGILAVLAWIGSLLGGIPGIPPAICGIIYLAIIFKVMCELIGMMIG